VSFSSSTIANTSPLPILSGNIHADIEVLVALEQGHHVALDGYQNSPDQRFESVRLPLDLFDDRTAVAIEPSG